MISDQEQELILESIRNDVDRIGEQLKEIALQVINDRISSFPVFVASHEHHNIGRPIFDPDRSTLNWNFHASLLEEFIQKELIRKDRVMAFQKAYQDPEVRACIFVFTPDMAQFIFVPYDLTEEDLEAE
ncbi:MAG: hypothetical protein NWR72_15775 [Bacteroidia bacterium]|nr:hypothetical protein [Bacteroidia bacterium]